MSDKRKIAILGGGMGSLTAAFEITSAPDWKEHFEVTVYQLGWRLGGKGASGRSISTPDSSPGTADRIEEHGLHIWLGHYENAFGLIQRCYAELSRLDSSAPAWTDAFKPFQDVMLMEKPGDRWIAWPVPDTSLPGYPGDGQPLPFPLRDLFHDWPADQVERLAELYNLMTAPIRLLDGSAPQYNALGLGKTGARRLAGAVDVWFREIARNRQAEHRVPRSNMAQVVLHDLAAVAGMALGKAKHSRLGLLENRGTSDGSLVDWIRRVHVVLDLTMAMASGIVEDDLIRRGYQAVDREEFSAYLARHGASAETLSSAVVVGAYQLAFAFPGGDATKPGVFAAGTALRCLLLLTAGCKGALFWKMQGGMGDVVFGPLYRVLAHRGVKFEFFHRVRNLAVSGHRITAVELGRQVRLRPGVECYEPLVELNTASGQKLSVWPNQPRYELIDFDPNTPQNRNTDFESFWRAPEDVETVTLLAGQHFHDVILGISHAALRYVTEELSTASDRFRAMIENIQTVQTQALQLWLAPPLRELGWTLKPPVLDAFEEPMDTWADMTHLLPYENWLAAKAPRTCAYLCSVLPDAPPDPGLPYDEQMRLRVRANAIAWLDGSSRWLWPAAKGPTGFRWELLTDLQGRASQDRIDGQYYRANVSPTERYVLSVPGTTEYRLRSDESGFENLYLAGDWLRTGLSAGCIECASMGGLQASHAISGRPKYIVRDDEP